MVTPGKSMGKVSHLKQQDEALTLALLGVYQLHFIARGKTIDPNYPALWAG